MSRGRAASATEQPCSVISRTDSTLNSLAEDRRCPALADLRKGSFRRELGVRLSWEVYVYFK